MLDIGCGSGEFHRLAADCGAEVSGIDAATGMIEVARRLVLDADLRVGAGEPAVGRRRLRCRDRVPVKGGLELTVRL